MASMLGSTEFANQPGGQPLQWTTLLRGPPQDRAQHRALRLRGTGNRLCGRSLRDLSQELGLHPGRRPSRLVAEPHFYPFSPTTSHADSVALSSLRKGLRSSLTAEEAYSDAHRGEAARVRYLRQGLQHVQLVEYAPEDSFGGETARLRDLRQKIHGII